MRFALLVRANVHDCSCFAAVDHDSDLRMRTLSRALRTTILTFVERVGRFGVDLPVLIPRNLNWLLSFSY